MLQSSLADLNWSCSGVVSCASHSPKPDSIRWTAEGWSRLPDGIQGAHGIVFLCQECYPDEPLIVDRCAASRCILDRAVPSLQP